MSPLLSGKKCCICCRSLRTCCNSSGLKWGDAGGGEDGDGAGGGGGCWGFMVGGFEGCDVLDGVLEMLKGAESAVLDAF